MTVPEPAFHISLYSKRTITQFRIVTCKSQIANSMQILFVNQLPVFSQLFFPLFTHLLVLRHNMLNCVLIHLHSFFTPVRSEEHTSELQSRGHLVCRLLLDTKKTSAF